jgi:hypothetical protein
MTLRDSSVCGFASVRRSIRTEIWVNGNEMAFRCKSLEQDKVVINNGYLLVE